MIINTNGTYDPLNLGETIPDIGKLAHYSLLVMSWILKENLQPPPFLTSIIHNNHLSIRACSHKYT